MSTNFQQSTPFFRMVLKESILMVMVSLVVAILYNAVSKNGLPLIASISKAANPGNPEIRRQNPDSGGYDDLHFIAREQAYQYFLSDTVVFIDARAMEDYRQGHISGALNIPVEQFNPEQVGRIPKDRLLITYCSDSNCDLAVDLAYGLMNHGFSAILVYHDGLVDWTTAQYPVERGE